MVATSVNGLILTIFSEFSKEPIQNMKSEVKFHVKYSISIRNQLRLDNSFKILNEFNDNSSEKTVNDINQAIIIIFIVTIFKVAL